MAAPVLHAKSPNGTQKDFPLDDYLPLTGGAMTGDIIFSPSTSAPDWSPLDHVNTITTRYGTKGTKPSDVAAVFMSNGCARDVSTTETWDETCRYSNMDTVLWPDGGTNFNLKLYKNEASATNGISIVMDIPASGQTNLQFDGQKIDFPAIWASSVDLLVRPKTNGTINLGNGSYRWKQLFATTTTISTSDERQKQNISAVPDAVLDAWGEVQWYQFQFNDAIEEKGDNARIHNGVIAQRIKSVFESHGLDATRYGLLCYDEWDAVPAEYDKISGKIINPALEAGNQYSIRYEEALCMEAAYQRRRADRLEERIARLEALLESK